MKYIIATDLLKSKNKKNIFYLGQWAADEKNLFNKSKILKFLWDDKKILIKDSIYIKLFCIKIINHLCRHLNKVHNVKYSPKFWKYILTIWIYSYVSKMFFMWETVKKVPKSNIFILNKKIYLFPPPDDTQSSLNFFQNSFWNQNIIHDIILFKKKKFLYKKFKKKHTISNNKLNLPSNLISFFFPFFIFKIINFIINLFPKIKIQLINSSYTSKFFLVFFPNFFFQLFVNKLIKKINNFIQCFLKKKEDVSLRIKFNEVLKNYVFKKNSFEEFIIRRIAIDFPKSFLETFIHLTTRYIKTFKSEKVITSYSFFDDTPEKFDIALKIQNDNTKIYLLEHGGALPPQEVYLDLFNKIVKRITWFKFSSNNLVQSNLNPIFFKYPVKNLDNLNYKNKDLLIIGGGHHKYVQYCSHFPEASQRLEQIIDLKKFTQNLKKNIKSHVILKPHPFYVKENNTFDYINLYKNIAKIKNFSKKNEDIISSINRSKILVCVYPETTFSEALVSGVPCILIFNKLNHFFEKSSKKLIKDLENCKIIFNSPILAAKHINSIWHNPLQWFNSAEVQKVREKFLNLALNKNQTIKNIKNKKLKFF